jgi:hypothetical protein
MVDTINRAACLRPKPMTSLRQKMNSRNVEKPDRLTPLLELEGKKTLLPPVEGAVFFLTSPFIERAYQTSGSECKSVRWRTVC